MIAHALGLGLYEKKKLWWLKEEEWKQCGYIVEKKRMYSLLLDILYIVLTMIMMNFEVLRY